MNICSAIIHLVNHKYAFCEEWKDCYIKLWLDVKKRMKEKNSKMKKKNCYRNLMRQWIGKNWNALFSIMIIHKNNIYCLYINYIENT